MVQYSTNKNYMFVMIDGTGPANAAEYFTDFHNSFLRQIEASLGPGLSKYYQGPRTDGQNTISIATEATKFIQEHVRKQPDADIYLGGYSRGGAAVMTVAQNLHGHEAVNVSGGGYSYHRAAQANIPIKAMFLLDPVTKYDGCPGGVHDNVEHCYYLKRDQETLHYTGDISPDDFRDVIDQVAVIGFQYKDPDRYARVFMGNASVEPVGNKTTHMHKWGSDGVIPGASHGAVGGLPWPERKADIGYCQTAADQLNGFMADFPITARVKAIQTKPPPGVLPRTDDEIRELIKKKAAEKQAAADAKSREYERIKNETRRRFPLDMKG